MSNDINVHERLAQLCERREQIRSKRKFGSRCVRKVASIYENTRIVTSRARKIEE